MDVAEFLDAHHANLSPAERALALDVLADVRADAAGRREEAARAAAAAERAELLQMAFRQGGISAGELQRFRAVAVAADDEVRDLSDRLVKAEAKRARAHAGIAALQRQLDEVSRSVASRSNPSLASEGSAVVRAQEVLREAAAQRVDDMLARAVVRSVSFPKDSQCAGSGCLVCSAARELERDRPAATLTAYTEIAR